ncbi:TPA: hypothetical protein F7009_11365 [Legionella pneumophila]|nr:hypothetical protein [Legionella pneumophila subsp. pneumophila]HAU1136463.1 hypothetical protein [Legionella pneumophila]HAU2543123.1 hypothetical protein [Legionella pneumophila]HAU3606390.1 hypothetical protein [Legionella pneumophila]HAU3713565.1 hypothetical protein [Legionella pneumophila]
MITYYLLLITYYLLLITYYLLLITYYLLLITYYLYSIVYNLNFYFLIFCSLKGNIYSCGLDMFFISPGYLITFLISIL